MKLIASLIFLLVAPNFSFAQEKLDTPVKVISQLLVRAQEPEKIKGDNNLTHNVGSSRKWIDNGYFGWWSTGNNDSDAINIENAAQEFKKHHHDVYMKIATDAPNVLEIPYNDFVSMPKENQDFILAHSNEYRVGKKEK